MSKIPAPTGRLRPIALAVIRRGDAMLVFQGHDPAKGETFYRPLNLMGAGVGSIRAQDPADEETAQ